MATRVNARWQVNGTEHTGSFTFDRAVKTGDPLRIWVDRNGNRVDAPTRHGKRWPLPRPD